MSTDTKIKTLIFNKLTQEQYNNADRVPTEFYLTPDTSIDSSEKGAANGVASLDSNTKVPVAQIPDLSSTYATINSLATVATSGMYSDLTGTPGVATADTLGLVKPDGTTITVTEDGTISATGGILVPDYSAGVAVTYPYTAPTAGLFVAYAGNGIDIITVNGVNTGLQFNSGNSASVMVAAGDVVSVSGNAAATCKFFPLKGALNV